MLRKWQCVALILHLGDNYRIGGAGDSMSVRIMDDVLSNVGVSACADEENNRCSPG